MDDVPIPIPPQPSRFMQQFRALMRCRQMAYSTEKTYAHWVCQLYSLSRYAPPK